MAQRTEGIPGIAVFLAAVGAYLMYVGIKNVPLGDGMKDLLKKGTLPPSVPGTPTPLPDYLEPGAPPASGPNASTGGGGGASGGSGLGSRIAAEAKSHQGVPYRWGGETPAGWDCSGLVTWVLVKVGAGARLPSKTHTTAAQFLVWSGATTVPRAQCQAGDLCCWAGHIGIAVDAQNMVNAPTMGVATRIQPIYAGVTIRRVLA